MIQRLSPAAILAAIVLLAFGGMATTYFVNDDYLWIRDTRVTSVAQLPQLLWRSTTLGQYFFRPLVNLSFGIDGVLWPMAPLGYHATNLVLHALSGLLLYRLVSGVGVRPGVALAAAIVFLVRPTHAEAVSWISSRTELLAATTILLALLLHLRLARGGIAAAATCFGAALLCKENAVVFPLLAAGSDRILGRRLSLPAYAAYAAILLAYAPLRWWALPHGPAGVVGFEPSLRFDNATLLHFLIGKVEALSELLVLPAGAPTIWLPLAFVGWLGISTSGSPKLRGLRLAGLLLFVPLLPHLAFFYTQRRYMYLPSAGAAVAVAVLLDGAGRYLTRIGVPAMRAAILWTGTALVVAASWRALTQEHAMMRLASDRAQQLLSETRRLVPAPTPGSVFHFFGLRRMSFGVPVPAQPFIFGLDAAVQLAYGEPTLGIEGTSDVLRLAQPLSPPGQRHGLRLVTLEPQLHLESVPPPASTR